MHTVIGILVHAKDSKGALIAANGVAKKMGDQTSGGPFDYYVDFTQPGMGVSGRDRWGPIMPVEQVSTTRFPTTDKGGLKMAHSAIEKNRRIFKSSMEEIRWHLANYTDDELFDEVDGRGKIEIDGWKIVDNPSSFRQYCEDACGGIPGPASHLYDYKGEPIRSVSHLQQILNDSDDDPYYFDWSEGRDPEQNPELWNQPLWIVPFDVHY